MHVDLVAVVDARVEPLGVRALEDDRDLERGLLNPVELGAVALLVQDAAVHVAGVLRRKTWIHYACAAG